MSIARRRGSSSLLGLGLALTIALAFLATPAQASLDYTIYDNTVGGTGPLGYGDATAQTSATMAQLQDGYYMVINDKVFYNFGGYSAAAIVDSPTLLAASAITVTPIVAATAPAGDGPGLMYQGPFFVKPGQEEDIAWSYTVATLNGQPLIHDSSLSLGGTQFSLPVSSISVGETVSDSSSNLLAPLSTFIINAPPPTGNVADLQFYHPVSLVNVTKDILLDASQSTGNPTTGTPTGFTTMDQRFSQVPEPSTMAIAGLGALGMIGYGLRRRKAQGA